MPGPEQEGLITYTRYGFMSATIMDSNPANRWQNLTYPPPRNDTGEYDAGWALIGKLGLAYAGPFSINTTVPANTTHGQLIHGPVTIASVPNWVGLNMTREYRILKTAREGTVLRLTARRGGSENNLWWKKIA